MKFEHAISIIRKNYPNRLIWTGFEYAGKYIFAIAADNQYIPGDAALEHIAIDQKTGEHGAFDFWKKVFDDRILQEAARKRVLVDITEAQANDPG